MIRKFTAGPILFETGSAVNTRLDKHNFKRPEELELLEEDKKKVLYDLIDTFIRDAKTCQAPFGRLLIKGARIFEAFRGCIKT